MRWKKLLVAGAALAMLSGGCAHSGAASAAQGAAVPTGALPMNARVAFNQQHPDAVIRSVHEATNPDGSKIYDITYSTPTQTDQHAAYDASGQPVQ